MNADALLKEINEILSIDPIRMVHPSDLEEVIFVRREKRESKFSAYSNAKYRKQMSQHFPWIRRALMRIVTT